MQPADAVLLSGSDHSFEATMAASDEAPIVSDDEHKMEKQVENVTRLFAQQNLHDIPSSRLHEIHSEERIEALQDLHGALDVAKETPEFVQEKLLELENALSAMDPDTRAAYDQALGRNADYVRSLHLSFLRAEKFDAIKAAIRTAKHFATRLSLFANPEILARDIQYSDFADDADRVALEMGIFQLLPLRDRAQRPVIFMNPTGAGEQPFHFPSLLRVLFWMSTLAANIGDDAQQKGIVLIWYGIGAKLVSMRRGRGPVFFDLFLTMNIKVSSIHMCYDDPECTDIANEVTSWSESRYLVRFQSHLGNHLECRYNLMTFGLPLDILPVTRDGKVHLIDHRRFLKLLQTNDHKNVLEQAAAAANEEASNDSARRCVVVKSPGPMDVILGRGRRGVKLPGNVMLKGLLEEHYDAYNDGSKVDKASITQLIYTQMQQAGCRFLKPLFDETKVTRGRPSPIGWVEVDNEAARDRIGHGFRNLRQASKS